MTEQTTGWTIYYCPICRGVRPVQGLSGFCSAPHDDPVLERVEVIPAPSIGEGREPPDVDESLRIPESELVERVTAIVREADEAFRIEGGSSRHWVRDQFLPRLAKAGIALAALDFPSTTPREDGEQS